MNSTSLAELALRMHGQTASPHVHVSGFATDNRQVKPGDLFLAIRGANVDGHDFVPSALSSGAAASLVERPVNGPHILVPDLVEALANMAESFRQGFAGPVVGITGSAGKTTTKEFVAAALAPFGPVLKTEGNRNTEYTAPLLWADLQANHRSAVVEMSMRGFGQVAHLAAFSKPTIGIITNIGHSHIELVGSQEGVARAKGELFEALPEQGFGLLWRGTDYFDLLKSLTRATVKTYGFEADADCRITRYEAVGWDKCSVGGTVSGQEWDATLGAVGRHIALGAAAAVLTASIVGIDPQSAASALAEAKLPPMRMEVRPWRGGTVLLDTYNASPASTIAAIETFAEMPVSGRRLAVIGEMRELGDFGEQAHREVGIALGGSGIEEVVFYGPLTRFAEEEAAKEGVVCQQATSMEQVRDFLNTVEEGDAVLVKGSRAWELEKALETH